MAKSCRPLPKFRTRRPLAGTVRIEAGDEIEILNNELMLAGRDHVYEEALALVARMTRY